MLCLFLGAMKLAAIDIGSNAVRLQITKVIEYGKQVTFKKLEYVRFPLRLGHDVFTEGKISKHNVGRFNKLMTAFRNLIDLYEVDACYGCATSAIRESENGKSLITFINETLDLDIKVISGEEEADMISDVIRLSLTKGAYIHIDVGGGSTELNVYQEREKTSSHSFEIGSVRRLEHSDSPERWVEMKEWINKETSQFERISAIGTGGNINKLFELSEQNKTDKVMDYKTLVRTQEVLKNLSMEDRLTRLQLNPDRADVIVPAADIYLEAMKSAGAKKILVPDVGLKDSINLKMYSSAHSTGGKVFIRN